MLVLVILAAAFVLVPQGWGQPTWNFKIRLLPSDLYMGEWGTVCANITNMDCVSKVDAAILFNNISERFLEQLTTRADQMLDEHLIADYHVEVLGRRGYGGEVFYDVNITIFRACSGRAVKLLRLLLWFPWKAYPGREMGALKEVNVKLKAFNPINFIVQGSDPESSTKVCFNVYIPPDIAPEERFKKPRIDVTIFYPGWMEYTLENYEIGGEFEINPYRSFNLTITDFDGVNVVPGAKVVIRRLAHYYEERSYIVPENGTIRILRLREGDYDVKVYWNSSKYIQRSPLIHVGIHTAYDLAASKTLRTSLFNVKVDVFDLKHRSLNGAYVVLDGVKLKAVNGSTVYQMVPEGNHSLQVYWMNVKLYDKWIWIGYHPTLMPEVRKPIFQIILPVDDLIIQAVDSGGNPVGARFYVRDSENRIPPVEHYSRTGLLNLTQLPAGTYIVKAVNCSKLFDVCVESSGSFSLGNLSQIMLPLHSLSLKVLTADGVELGNASVSLGPVSTLTDERGSVIFAGIPEGAYRLRVAWRGVTVYDEDVQVSKAISKKIVAKVYDLDFELKTMDGLAFTGLWTLRDPSGAVYSSDKPTSRVEVKLIPGGTCLLTIHSTDNRTVFSKSFDAKTLHDLKYLELPIKSIMMKVVWPDGVPLEGAEVILMDESGFQYSLTTDDEGRIFLHDFLLKTYTVKVMHPTASIPIMIKNITFTGENVTLTIKSASLMIRIVDILGNPVKGAEVSVLCNKIPLAKAVSDENGLVRFERLPDLKLYEVSVRYRSLRSTTLARSNEISVVKLNAISLLGFVVGVEDMIPYLVGAVVVAIILASIMILRRVIRRRREFY